MTAALVPEAAFAFTAEVNAALVAVVYVSVGVTVKVSAAALVAATEVTLENVTAVPGLPEALVIAAIDTVPVVACD